MLAGCDAFGRTPALLIALTMTRGGESFTVVEPA